MQKCIKVSYRSVKKGGKERESKRGMKILRHKIKQDKQTDWEISSIRGCLVKRKRARNKNTYKLDVGSSRT